MFRRRRLGPAVSVRSAFLTGLRGWRDARAGVPDEGCRELAPVPAELAAARRSDLGVARRRRDERIQAIDAGVGRDTTAAKHASARAARAGAEVASTQAEMAATPRPFGRGPGTAWFAAAMTVLVVVEYPLNRWAFARSPIADWLVDLLVLGIGVTLVAGADVGGMALSCLIRRPSPTDERALLHGVVRGILWSTVGLILGALVGAVVTFGLIRIGEFRHRTTLAHSAGIPAVAAGVALMLVQAVMLAVATYLALSYYSAGRLRRLRRRLRGSERDRRKAQDAADTLLASAAALGAARRAVLDQHGGEAEAITHHYERLARRWSVAIVRRKPARQDEIGRQLRAFDAADPPTPPTSHAIPNNTPSPLAPNDEGADR